MTEMNDLFESAPCGYIEIGKDGLIRSANRKFLELIGREREAIVGATRFASLLTVGGRMYYETHFSPLLQMHGEVHEIAFDLVRSDGSRIPILVSANVRDPHGDPVVRTIVFEAKDRRSYEKELLVAKKMAEEAEAHARSLAQTLQQTFVPPAPPDILGLDLSGVYRPAGDGSEVGGDFYDVFQIGAGEWFVALGDVSGKGVEAAALTTFIRHSLRAIAVDVDPPADVLRELNTALMNGGFDRFCTVVVLRMLADNDQWLVTMSSGGHPLPILRKADGTVATVGKPGSLIGALDMPSLDNARFEFDVGDALVLYTDGVTEARRKMSQYGDERLARLVRDAGPAAGEITAAVLADVMEFQGPYAKDDIAVVAITAQGGPLERSHRRADLGTDSAVA